MITKRSAARFDAIDTERFETMIESPAFALYRARLVDELERARGDCEAQDDLKPIHRAQGVVHGLRTALGLPQAIAQEMRGKLTK